MIKIPLRYSDRVFGHALTDDSVEPLSTLGYYSVTLPRVIRHLAGKRPDVILATLKEDPIMRARCTPFVSMFGTQVLLVHMIVRNSLGQLMVEHHENSDVASLQCSVRADLNEIRSSIGRIVYANGDRTDCRVENIREI